MAARDLAPRVSRAEAVASKLADEIMAGNVSGDRLGTKDELRRQFGVAAATINEAVRLLETRGLIFARPGPGGGVFLARPAARVSLAHMVLGIRSDTDSYTECLEIRDALEPLVCRAAARNHKAADIKEMKRILRDMEKASDDPARYFELNWLLHRRIAQLCRNTTLRSIYLTLLDFLEATVEQAEYEEFDGPANVVVHEQLVAAIDEGEGPGLERALEAHMPLPRVMQG